MDLGLDVLVHHVMPWLSLHDCFALYAAAAELWRAKPLPAPYTHCAAEYERLGFEGHWWTVRRDLGRLTLRRVAYGAARAGDVRLLAMIAPWCSPNENIVLAGLWVAASYNEQRAKDLGRELFDTTVGVWSWYSGRIVEMIDNMSNVSASNRQCVAAVLKLNIPPTAAPFLQRSDNKRVLSDLLATAVAAGRFDIVQAMLGDSDTSVALATTLETGALMLDLLSTDEYLQHAMTMSHPASTIICASLSAVVPTSQLQQVVDVAFSNGSCALLCALYPDCQIKRDPRSPAVCADFGQLDARVLGRALPQAFSVRTLRNIIKYDGLQTLQSFCEEARHLKLLPLAEDQGSTCRAGCMAQAQLLREFEALTLKDHLCRALRHRGDPAVIAWLIEQTDFVVGVYLSDVNWRPRDRETLLAVCHALKGRPYTASDVGLLFVACTGCKLPDPTTRKLLRRALGQVRDLDLVRLVGNDSLARFMMAQGMLEVRLVK